MMELLVKVCFVIVGISVILWKWISILDLNFLNTNASETYNKDNESIVWELKGPGLSDADYMNYLSEWKKFSVDNHCLIDGVYDQLIKSLKPFQDFIDNNPVKADYLLNLALNLNSTMIVSIRNGIWKTKYKNQPEPQYLPNILKREFQGKIKLPDVDLAMNTWDEPQVYRSDFRNIDLDEDPIIAAHKATEDASFPYEMCWWLKRWKNTHGFLECPPSSPHQKYLVPMLSMTRVKNCGGDLLGPTKFDWRDHSAPPDIPWHRKQNVLHWRGSNTGGCSKKIETHHQNHRIRLVKWAKQFNKQRTNGVTADIGFAGYVQRDAIIRQNLKKTVGLDPYVPRHSTGKFKYLMDIDGNSFSRRFPFLLNIGSVVFKATLFDMFYDGRLTAYKHYVPVKPDLSDLESQLQFAENNQELMKKIAAEGRKIAPFLANSPNSNCYMYRLLIEYARLFRPVLKH